MRSKTSLKNAISDILIKQGYLVQADGSLLLGNDDRETRREAHLIARGERMFEREAYIRRNIPLVSKFFLEGRDLEIDKIKPKLIEVKPETKEEVLFGWWNITWWSLPYERAYGRQMRFVVWDEYHNAPIGLIGLQSPMLSWNVRDEFLKIKIKDRDYWVNQSLSAQRIGALPPYNDILAGKLVTMLMTSDEVRKRFARKYKGRRTILKNRVLPNRLLFITTTGAYGKSSVYQRLKYKNEIVAKFIGFSSGKGTFHIPNSLYQELVSYLRKRGYEIQLGYGHGPSQKLRIIDQALQTLGFVNGVTHGIKRAVYLFPLASNLNEVINQNKRPKWYIRDIKDMSDFWKERWAIPRSQRNKQYLNYRSKDFLDKILYNLDQYRASYSEL